MGYKNYLKIKVVSLTEEAKLIRKDEYKRLKAARRALSQGKEESAAYHSEIFKGLRYHRIWDVRNEARVSNIAYGFLQGHEYKDIERNAIKQVRWMRVQGLVLRYGEGDPSELFDRFQKWKQRARSYFRHVSLERLIQQEERRLAKLEPVVTEDLHIRIVPRHGPDFQLQTSIVPSNSVGE